MDGVAIGADYAGQSVRRAADVRPAEGFGVAPQAVVQHCFRPEFGEGDNGRLTAARRYVGLTGAMAALASGPFRRFFAGCEALVMRILVEVCPDVGVAGPANITADIRRAAYGLGMQRNGQAEDKGN